MCIALGSVQDALQSVRDALGSSGYQWLVCIRVDFEVQRNVIWRSGESSTIHILSYFWALLLQVNTLAFGIFLLATVPGLLLIHETQDPRILGS